MAAIERELATLTEAVKTLSSEVGGLRSDFKDVATTQARHSVEISDIKDDVGVAHTRITTVSTRLWGFAAAMVLMVVAGVVKAGTKEGGTQVESSFINQLLSGDMQSAIAFIAVAILNIGVVAGARSWAMAKGKEFLSSGRAAWIIVFIVCLLEKLVTGHLNQLGDPSGLLEAIKQSISDASAATVGVLGIHTTGKTLLQGALRGATIQQSAFIPCGNSTNFSMQAVSLSSPSEASHILDVLNALDPVTRDRLLLKLQESGSSYSQQSIRQMLYESVDKIPTRWGKLGAFLFRLLVAPRLYRVIDEYVDKYGLDAGGLTNLLQPGDITGVV